MESLTLFDKIRLAECAVKRAELNVCDKERFLGEYLTASLWKVHSINSYRSGDGKSVNYKEV